MAKTWARLFVVQYTQFMFCQIRLIVTDYTTYSYVVFSADENEFLKYNYLFQVEMCKDFTS
jgi:hypothetical protein